MTQEKPESAKDLFIRLEKLQQWHEDQQDIINEKLNAQKQVINSEHERVYENFGFSSRPSQENDVNPLPFDKENGAEGKTSENHQPAKQRFLKRGEGLKNRFNMDPDVFRLHNLPKYKLRNIATRSKNRKINKTKEETKIRENAVKKKRNLVDKKLQQSHLQQSTEIRKDQGNELNFESNFHYNVENSTPSSDFFLEEFLLKGEKANFGMSGLKNYNKNSDSAISVNKEEQVSSKEVINFLRTFLDKYKSDEKNSDSDIQDVSSISWSSILGPNNVQPVEDNRDKEIQLDQHSNGNLDNLDFLKLLEEKVEKADDPLINNSLLNLLKSNEESNKIHGSYTKYKKLKSHPIPIDVDEVSFNVTDKKCPENSYTSKLNYAEFNIDQEDCRNEEKVMKIASIKNRVRFSEDIVVNEIESDYEQSVLDDSYPQRFKEEENSFNTPEKMEESVKYQEECENKQNTSVSSDDSDAQIADKKDFSKERENEDTYSSNSDDKDTSIDSDVLPCRSSSPCEDEIGSLIRSKESQKICKPNEEVCQDINASKERQRGGCDRDSNSGFIESVLGKLVEFHLTNKELLKSLQDTKTEKKMSKSKRCAVHALDEEIGSTIDDSSGRSAEKADKPESKLNVLRELFFKDRRLFLNRVKMLTDRIALWEREISSQKKVKLQLLHCQQELQIKKKEMEEGNLETQRHLEEQYKKKMMDLNEQLEKCKRDLQYEAKIKMLNDENEHELRKQIEELKNDLKEKEIKHGSSQARLRSQIRNLENQLRLNKTELDNLRKDIKRLESENLRLKRRSVHTHLTGINSTIKKLDSKDDKKATKSKSTSKHSSSLLKSQSLSSVVEVDSSSSSSHLEIHKSDQNLIKKFDKDSKEKFFKLDVLGNKICKIHTQIDDLCSGNVRKRGGEEFVSVALKNDELLTQELQKENQDENSSEKNDVLEIVPAEQSSKVRIITNSDGSKDILYKNGNMKKISPDGMIIRMLYYNKDIKETNISEGTVRYYYAETNTWHTTYLDGLEVLEFPNGQTELRHKTGVTEVRFPNGSVKITDPKNPTISEEWRFSDGKSLLHFRNGDKMLKFPNGQKEVETKAHKRREYPDGTVKFVFPDGSQETRYSNGRRRIKDKDGKLIMDSTDISKD